MGITDTLFHLLGDLLFERPAQKKSIEELRTSLQESHRAALQTIEEAPDTDENREILRHVIGIERWGQRRLRVALGEPLVMDEYDEYRPAKDTSLPALQESFDETRRDTIKITHELAGTHGNGATTVPHNQWGDLSVRGWLNYLNSHARRDIKGLN